MAYKYFGILIIDWNQNIKKRRRKNFDKINYTLKKVLLENAFNKFQAYGIRWDRKMLLHAFKNKHDANHKKSLLNAKQVYDIYQFQGHQHYYIIKKYL